MSRVDSSQVVEVCMNGYWHAPIRPSAILAPSGDLLECLFGVPNRDIYPALFPERGFPPNASDEIWAQWNELLRIGAPWGASWATHEELAAVNWDETIELRSRVVENGVADRLAPSGAHSAADLITSGVPTISRRDAWDESNFDIVMELMAVLVRRFGGGNVRWVVLYFVISGEHNPYASGEGPGFPQLG